MTSSMGRAGLFAEEALPAGLREHLGQTYELQRELVRGGMSSVWLARHLESGRAVAIKTLRPSFAQALGVPRFLREIQIAANVRASSLVPLEDSGVVDGLPYYVMPFIDGGSLRDRLARERQLPIAEAIRVARAIATALGVLHDAGIMHRDVKPANVLLSLDGDVLLADYGIARAVEISANDKLTSTGIALGTPAYMSPEQAAADVLDVRSDLYSLGCVLYEMLTGNPPFHGQSAQAVIARHIAEPPASVHIVRPSVPPSLEAIVLRTLAKVPADRYESAKVLVAALDQVDVGASTETRRAILQRRTRWSATGLLVAIVVAGSLWYARWNLPLDQERVVVYPFADLRAGRPSEGAELALLVGSALERAEPTKWLDGWKLLNATERGSARALSTARAASLARQQEAGYYLAGVVSSERDSLRVTVSLHDVAKGEVTSASAVGARSASASDLALDAVVRLLPIREGLGRVVDVSALRRRNPSAVAKWLRGERLYRQSRIAESEVLFQSALAEDSTLAPAALRAALTSSWLSRTDTARALVRLALRHDDALSPRQKQFGRALERWLEGRANEAITALRPLLTTSSATTADAWMLAGEVHLHLLPTVTIDSQANRAVPAPRTWPLTQFAEAAFDSAHLLDPSFTPPLAHLAELAARRGDADSVARIIRLLGAANPDSAMMSRLEVMQRCVKEGAQRFDAAAEAKKHLRTIFDVGMKLLGATEIGARRCALAAFRAVLSSDAAIGAEDWSSLIALHGMLAAAHEDRAAVQLVDSAIASGMAAAVGLYVVDEAAGMDVGDRPKAFVDQLQSQLATRAAPSLWLLTLSSARAGDTVRLAELDSLLGARVTTTGGRLDSLVARAAGGYLALARRDTAAALARFGSMQPTASNVALEATLWEALAPERLTYARLLLARGNAAEAHRIASLFDNPLVLVHQLFLRQSLELRLEAARLLRDSTLEMRARDRLAALRAAVVP